MLYEDRSFFYYYTKDENYQTILRKQHIFPLNLRTLLLLYTFRSRHQ